MSGGSGRRRERALEEKPRSPEGVAKSAGLGAWGTRWIEALVELPGVSAARVERGIGYAREGRVQDVRVEEGKIKAQVSGSQPKPYSVSLHMALLENATWEKAIEAMIQSPKVAAALLARDVPLDVDSIFQALGVSLFPLRETDLVTRCSCPDWSTLCKHVAALEVVLAGAIDRDPFLLFELRGRSKEQILAAIQEARSNASTRAGAVAGAGAGAGAGGVGGESLATASSPPVSAIPIEALSPSDYELSRGDLGAIRLRIEPLAEPGAILKPLGQPPSWSRREPVGSWLDPTYQAASELARDLALAIEGDGPPQARSGGAPAARPPKRAGKRQAKGS